MKQTDLIEIAILRKMYEENKYRTSPAVEHLFERYTELLFASDDSIHQEEAILVVKERANIIANSSTRMIQEITHKVDALSDSIEKLTSTLRKGCV